MDSPGVILFFCHVQIFVKRLSTGFAFVPKFDYLCLQRLYAPSMYNDAAKLALELGVISPADFGPDGIFADEVEGHKGTDNANNR